MEGLKLEVDNIDEELFTIKEENENERIYQDTGNTVHHQRVESAGVCSNEHLTGPQPFPFDNVITIAPVDGAQTGAVSPGTFVGEDTAVPCVEYTESKVKSECEACFLECVDVIIPIANTTNGIDLCPGQFAPSQDRRLHPKQDTNRTSPDDVKQHASRNIIAGEVILPKDTDWNSVPKHESDHVGLKTVTANSCVTDATVNEQCKNTAKKVDLLDNFSCEGHATRDVQEKNSTDDVEKKYECSTCGKKFICAPSLRRHIYTHTQRNAYQCVKCGKRFGQSSHLKTHELTHTKQRAHKCPTCGYKFRRIDALRAHQLTHSEERPHQCGVCGKGFKRVAHLNRHQKVHQKGDKRRKKLKHMCPTCGRGFSRCCDLKSHLLVHSAKKVYECKVCGKEFTTSAGFTVHRRKTHKIVEDDSHKCAACGKRFAHQDILMEHMASHDEVRSKVSKPYHCTVCDKNCTLASGLKVHMMTHTGEKPHKCKTCGVGCITRNHLQKHELVHTGERPHLCSTCGRAFRVLYNLQLHERVHSEVKPFKCSVCGKGMTSSSRLKRHEKIHLKHKVKAEIT